MKDRKEILDNSESSPVSDNLQPTKTLRAILVVLLDIRDLLDGIDTRLAEELAEEKE